MPSVRRCWRSLAVGVTAVCATATAHASPGEGQTLSGLEAQGPASTHLSAVFHNPAMLTDLPGLHLQLGGVATLHTQRTAPATFNPSGFAPMQRSLNWGADGFFGASFLFENFAIAAAYYSLDSKFRERAPAALDGFVRANPTPYCKLRPGTQCDPSASLAGWAEVRSEFTLALAWQTIRRLRVGLALHVPRYSLRGARVRDPESQPVAGLCRSLHPMDESCQEVEQLRFRTSWRGQDPAGSRIQLGMTLGVAWAPNTSWTVGARFRLRPNFGLRAPIYQGTLKGCAISPSKSPEERVRCESTQRSSAQLGDQPGRQVALGASFRPRRRPSLRVDGQAYWIQYCPDDQRRQGCLARADAQMSQLGSDPTGLVIVDRPWYRGHQDRFGAELWLNRSLHRSARPRLRRFAYTLGLGGYRALVDARAHNPVDDDGHSLFGAASVAFELLRRNSSMFLVTGYGLTWQRPRDVGRGSIEAAFDPQAFESFKAQFQDIDTPAGQTVLAGRAKSSNAALYRAHRHILSLSLRWGARN